MVKFFKKIWHILIANLYYRPFNKNEYLYIKRYKLCNECEHKKDHAIIGEFCDLCGCPLKSKLRVKDEKCIINKW